MRVKKKTAQRDRVLDGVLTLLLARICVPDGKQESRAASPYRATNDAHVGPIPPPRGGVRATFHGGGGSSLKGTKLF